MIGYVVAIIITYLQQVPQTLTPNPQPSGIIFISSDRLLDNSAAVASAQMLIAMKRVKLGEGRRRLNQDFANIFRDVYARLCFKVRLNMAEG